MTACGRIPAMRPATGVTLGSGESEGVALTPLGSWWLVVTELAPSIVPRLERGIAPAELSVPPALRNNAWKYWKDGARSLTHDNSTSAVRALLYSGRGASSRCWRIRRSLGKYRVVELQDFQTFRNKASTADHVPRGRLIIGLHRLGVLHHARPSTRQ